MRPPFIPYHLTRLPEGEREEALERLAYAFARLRIRNPLKEVQEELAMPLEVEYERRRLRSPAPPFGIAYHGFGVMRLLEGLLPGEERRLSRLHLVFTNQLLATWGEGRYHLRVVALGYPCLLSTTGAVEAPAKPREFYLLKQHYSALGMPDAVVELEKELGERVLVHDDPRLTEVMKGYLMQAVLYSISGEGFCEDRNCRLFNAHWQEELVRAQIGGEYEFCPRHRELLEALR